LCLVFGEEGDFPSNRSDLYVKGVRVLLKKWDSKRNIERDDKYKKLDVQRREDLLSYVAFKMFQEKEYFVNQRRMETYIEEFIKNLRDVDPDPESLRCDSEVVLESIQAQHGLLVERARDIYSFSHLMFQEYFTAREIVTTNNIKVIVQHIRDPRWREVFFLTTGMLRSADELLSAMKSSVDLLLASDSSLQRFLKQINVKAASVYAPCKLSTVRAFYFALSLADICSLNDHDIHVNEIMLIIYAISKNLVLSLELEYIYDRDEDMDLSFFDNFVHDLSFDFDLINVLHEWDHLMWLLNSDIELNSELEYQLRRLSNEERLGTKETNWTQWREDLRQVIITHRNIGHNWQFTDDQKQLLQQYYDASFLLVQCLNSDCRVSRHVRESIEETLLLPIEEC